MHTKLDIEISLSERYVSDGIFNHFKKILAIKVNAIDQRFQVFNCIKCHELFIGKNGLRILSSLDVPLGAIHNYAIILPSPKQVGVTIYHDFMYDDERKDYLKKLYISLQEWSKDWWGFSGDSESKLVVYGNRWVIECGKPSELFMTNDVEVNDVY